MGLLRGFTSNWADTAEPSHSDLHAVELQLPPAEALEQIQRILQAQPHWRVERINGQPLPPSPCSSWPWVNVMEAFMNRLTPVPKESAFRTGPARPNVGWLAATRRTSLMRYIDDVLIWLEEAPGGCRVQARSRSRTGRGDLGQNRRNLRELFGALEALRRNG